MVKCESPFTISHTFEDNASPTPDPEPSQPSAIPAAEQPEPIADSEPETATKQEPITRGYFCPRARAQRRVCPGSTGLPRPSGFTLVNCCSGSANSSIVLNLTGSTLVCQAFVSTSVTCACSSTLALMTYESSAASRLSTPLALMGSYFFQIPPLDTTTVSALVCQAHVSTLAFQAFSVTLGLRLLCSA
ncbi:hypothetical protein PO909_032657 [Leuciscus waleckii]